MVETVKASIPSSLFDYRAPFAEPIFSGWETRSQLLASVFESLKPWSVSLSDVTIQDENSGNARVQFEIPRQRLTLTVSLGYMGVTVTQPDWGQEKLIADIILRATKGVMKFTGTTVSEQYFGLHLHLVPEGSEPRAIFSPLANPRLAGVFWADGAYAWGFSVYGPLGYRTIDLSRQVPGAIYVGLQRRFAAADTLERAAAWLREEESQVLTILGLHLD
jgi:hypothetical protein